MIEKKSFSLSIILKRVKQIVDDNIKGKTFWLRTEISNINFHNSGHCYLDITETKEGKSIANCKATIWASAYQIIRNQIGKDLNNILKKGNEILCLASIEFSEIYGLSIRITDIDLNFSLGNLERKKQETIKKLKDENIIDLNKLHKLPTVIQKIAVIGAPNTAGYTDFMDHLNKNPYNYKFTIITFPCLVQGEGAEIQILEQFKKLKTLKFDIIALIRGGGSKLDLEVFNSYNISKEIALHNLPVLTGIGHETDYNVADMVANHYLKTPSALAAFIIERANNFENKIITAFTAIKEIKDKILENKKSHLNLNTQTLTSFATSFTRLRRGDLHTVVTRINTIAFDTINLNKNKINLSKEGLKTLPANSILKKNREIQHTVQMLQLNSVQKINSAIDTHKNTFELIHLYAINSISSRKDKIKNIQNVVGVYHPASILSKGYAIPRLNGKLLSLQNLSKDEIIEIELKNRYIITKFISEK